MKYLKFTYNRAFFNRVLEVIRLCFGFTSLHFVIGLENTRHSLNKPDINLKTIATRSFMYSRASSGLQVVSYFESSLADDDVIFFLIGRCDNFGFCFLILSLKLFYFLAYLCSRVKKNKPCVFRDKVYTSPPLLHRNFLGPPLLMWSLNPKQTRGTQQNFTTWYE